jgi:hypothetical protein
MAATGQRWRAVRLTVRKPELAGGVTRRELNIFSRSTTETSFKQNAAGALQNMPRALKMQWSLGKTPALPDLSSI